MQLFSNNFKTTLSAAVDNVTTSITVVSSVGLPTLGVGDTVLVTLESTDRLVVEIVEVTAVVGNVLTVVRGREGTVASSFGLGSFVEGRLTAGWLNQVGAELGGKQDTITGAATTITSSNLTASMAMVSDVNGKVAAHGTVSATELGYLHGVTSSVQTQLNSKEPTITTLPVSKGGTGVGTLTGLVKGNGTGAMSAAVAGTDYVVPSGSITGNAATATVLQTARTINGVSFNGSANITIADSTKIPTTEKGAANGVATLDANGKVVLTQIPDSVLGQLEYMGTHNFTTMPTATQKGQYWIASVAGNGYEVGDWAVYNGTTFDKVDNTDAVSSVAGRTGNVVLTKSDVGLTNVDNTADSSKNVATAATWTTARTITIGNTGKSVNGSANVSWSLAEIGAQAAGNYQPLDADLTAIAGLAGTSGFLKKTAADTWALDTNTYLTGNQGITFSGDATGSGTTSVDLTLANTGVTAGTYKSLTVDAKGRVTAGTNPTTLAGYGITDAASSTHNHTLDSLSNVTITSNTSGEILKWNGTAWINNTLAEAGIQPAGSYLTANQTITFSGDATGSGSTSVALALANSGVAAGTYNNSATAVKPLVVDAKGRITGVGADVTITPAFSSITGKPTTLAGYGITDAATSTHNHTIDSLSNVVITANSDNEVLAWDATTSKWINQTAAEAGLAASTHTHSNATTSVAGFMSSTDKTKLDGIATGANNYVHPTGDGNLHVPATGTTNNGKVLTAGATAGSLSWTAIPAALVSSVAGKTGAVTLVKGDVGLGSVDNTADAVKVVASAGKLTTARTINGVSFDGTANITISDATKAPLASPALTGTPTAPTAAVGTNTTQLATTAFVHANSVIITGNQTIGGVKTFSSSPIVPTATASGQAVNFGQFDKSLGTNGYQKLPSGLIIQWGDNVLTTSAGGGGVFTYPIAFPNKVFTVMVSGGDNSTVTPYVRVNSQMGLTNCGFQTTSTNTLVRVTYIAIGG